MEDWHVSTHPNAILNHLSKSDLALFEGALTARSFVRGDVLAEIDSPIDHAYFPSCGLISLVVPLQGGEVIEAGVVGRQDVFGASAAFGAKVHVNRAVAQISGVALVIKAAELIKAAHKSETLRHDLFMYDQFILAQAQQSAACNARHDISQRLATWLLRISDRAQQDELPLTQEFLSQMLGVQRASVSIAAGAMQEAGMIQYRRGRLKITDPNKLEEIACECYAAVRAHHERAAPIRMLEPV